MRVFAWMQTTCRTTFEDTLHTGRQRLDRRFSEPRAQRLESNARVHSDKGPDGDGNAIDEGGARLPDHEDAAATTKRVFRLCAAEYRQHPLKGTKIRHEYKNQPGYSKGSRIWGGTIGIWEKVEGFLNTE